MAKLDVVKVSILVTDREGLIRQAQITNDMANQIFEFIKESFSGKVMMSEPLNGKPISSAMERETVVPVLPVDPKTIFMNPN